MFITHSLQKKLISRTSHPLSFYVLNIYNQTQGYLQRNELFYICNYGFIANHSTDTCFFSFNRHDLKRFSKWKTNWYDINIFTKRFLAIQIQNELYSFFRRNNKMKFSVSLEDVFSEGGKATYRGTQNSWCQKLNFTSN